MPYAVEAYLDRQTEQQVTAIWDALADDGVTDLLPRLGARPHITLTCYDMLDAGAWHEKLCAFARDHAPIKVSLPFIGVFPKGYVFLGATPTPELMQLHRDYHEAFAGVEDRSFELYQPGLWIPHCSLGMDLPQAAIPKVVALAQQVPLPLTGTLEQIALIRFRPTQELVVCPLEG